MLEKVFYPLTLYNKAGSHDCPCTRTEQTLASPSTSVTGYTKGHTIIFLDKHPGQFGFFYFVMNTTGLLSTLGDLERLVLVILTSSLAYHPGL